MYMDKDKNDKGKTIKLSNNDRKLLRSIDKSSKWEDVSKIEGINDEIINLDIYKDFIGLGCSRYLNEAGESGKLDVEEMFRNCREAEKVRIRVNKKQRKEEAMGKRAGKAGLTKGNIGANVRNEVKPKEVESQQMKESPIVSKARQLSKDIIDGLTKSEKGDDWKAVISKTGLKFGLEGLFGLVIGVVEYSIDNPVGAIAITPAMIGIMSKIYQYIYETETGKKVVGNVVEWFKGKLNELIDYLMGKDIKVVKKKKKKKPFDRGSGDKKDDDDDDDDDSGGSDFEFDFDELNEYEGKTETKKEAEEEVKKEEQDLRTQQAPPQQEGIVNQLVSTLNSQLAQAQTQLVNTNTARLFQQNDTQRNPLPRSEGTATSTRTNQPPNPTQDKEDPKPQENINPSSSLLRGAGILSAVGGAGLAGISQLNRMFGIGTPTIPPQPQQPPQTGSLNEPVVQPDPASDNLNNQGQMTDERREQEELLRKQQEDREKQQETERKVNQAIDDMDIRGRAWGAVLGGMSGGGGSKTAQANSIIPIYNRQPQATQTEMLGLQTGTQTETIGSLLSQEEAQEQQSLIEDVERSAEEARMTSMKIASENERLQAELSLIRAREGKEPERKMTAEEADIVKEQQEAERQAQEQREEKQKQRQTLREQEMERLEREMGEVSMEEKTKPKTRIIKIPKSKLSQRQQGGPKRIPNLEVGQTTMNALTLQNDDRSPPQPTPLTPPEETLMMAGEDRDVLTRREEYKRFLGREGLQMSSLQNTMSNNEYQGQSIIESTLAGEMILGMSRGRPRGDAQQQSAREYLLEVLNLGGRDITINGIRDFVRSIDPNTQVSRDLQKALEELQVRTGDERKGGKAKPNYKLQPNEIQAIANIIKRNELRRREAEAGRQR